MGHIKINYIDDYISKTLIEKDRVESAAHKSSGKLSAGMLGKPLQSQILKIRGVPPQDVDAYTLRKFQRGKDVEEWLVKNIPDKVDFQKFVEYRNVVGFVDTIVDARNWNGNDFGIMPNEIKSVTNRKFANIKKSGTADRGHLLQCALYALSLASRHFAVTYVASDDYRIITFVYETANYVKEVDDIITRFDTQLSSGRIPAFVAEESWQSNPKYSDYPDWIGLTEEECNLKFKNEYEK